MHILKSKSFSSVRNTYLIRISACFQKTTWSVSSLFDYMINYHGLNTRLPLPWQLFNQHESHRKHKRLLSSVVLFRNGRPSSRFVMYHIQVTDVIINYTERHNGIIPTVVQTKRASMGKKIKYLLIHKNFDPFSKFQEPKERWQTLDGLWVVCLM